MTSFATDEAVRAHVAERGLGDPLWFCQTAAPRLRPDGSLFLDADGQASLYGPGHGDLLGDDPLVGHARRARRAAASRTVVVSNVDNLGARLDPAIVGMHLLAGTPLTVEVVGKGNDTRRRAGAGRRPSAARSRRCASRPSSIRLGSRSSTRTPR